MAIPILKFLFYWKEDRCLKKGANRRRRKEGKIIVKVSDLITVKDIKAWDEENSIVTIDGQTGVGKSYFIKNVLYNHAKAKGDKILFLVHRLTCLDQFQNEIQEDEKLDVIEFMTYQSIDNKLRAHKKVNLNDYHYIVADEYHYFFSDAWNNLSDLSLDFLLKAKDKVRILISATPAFVKRYINKFKNVETIDYYIERDYSYIKQLQFYKNRDSIHTYIKQILKRNEKALIFVKSARRAYELHELYKDKSMFLCSESNSLHKYVDKDKREQLLKNEKFEDSLLFTTLTLEAGVNIIDSELTNIIYDVDYSIDKMIQCIGRKRIAEESDYINLYIKAISNKSLGASKKKLQEKLSIAHEYICSWDKREWITKNYRRQFDKLFYDEPTPLGIDKQMNYVQYHKYKYDNELVSDMLELKNNNYGYCQYISNELGVPYTILEDNNIMNDLEIYLDSIVGKKLFKDERWELIEKVHIKDKQYRLQKGLSQINAYLEENNMKYRIESNKDKRRKLENGEPNPNRDKSYWIIGKITYGAKI